jgi:hypothetical protein
MPFITLGTTDELQIAYPTNNTTSWGDTVRTDTFQKIAEHDHTGSGRGRQLGAGSLADDAVTGAKFRLDNNEALRARDFADSTNLGLIKINTSDKIELEQEIGAALRLSNNIEIQARDNADSTYLSLIKLSATDKIELGAEIAALKLANDTFITARNNADSADINLLKLDTNDDLLIDAELSQIKLKNNISLQARNNADSADIDILKVSASDVAEATLGQINAQGLVTLTDNTSVAADAGVITLASNETCEIVYKIIRDTDVQRGTLTLDENNSSVIEEFSGDEVGVTFSINAGALEYVSTNTGSNATMSYTIIKQ